MKSLKKKRLGTSILAAVLSLTFMLAGCSGNSGPSGNKENSPPSGNDTVVTEPGQDGDQEPVTLKFISWKDGTYDELYELFHQKYPWITIEQIPVNKQPIMEIIASLEAAGTPADVTEIDTDLVAFEQGELIEDLTPYIEKSEIFQNAKFPEGFLDTMTFNSKRLAIPMVDVPMWILVNKDLLAKHGVDMPSNDWTYDDFRNIAKQITDSNAGEYGVTSQPEIQMRMLSSKAIADGYAANHQYMNEDMTQSLLSTPEIMNEVKWFQELVTKDGSMQSNAAAEADGNVTKDFINGKTGFAIGGDWVLPTLKEKAPFQWDVLPFPKGKVSQPGYSIYGPLAMLAGSKQKEAAFLWLSFQFTPEAQKWKIDQGANASVNDSEITAYYDEAPIWEGKNIEAVKIAQQNARIQSGLTVVGWREYNYNNLLNDIIFGDRDINDIIPETEAWNKKTIELRESLK
ncbi:ABC transporter substrate-binding protein [Paenibacillus taichungensis]|nr:extracellular solute-binding protein [Paenibacillus taichungensis]